MKTIKYLAAAAASLLMAACTLELDKTTISGAEEFVSPVLSEVADVVSDANTSGVEQVVFTWSSAYFGADTQVEYSLYAKLGDKTALIGQSYSNTMSIAKGDLVGVVVNGLGGEKNTDVAVESYLEAIIYGSATTDTLRSNSVAYSVYTYLPAKKNIWLPGAYQGWDQFGTMIWEYAAGTSQYKFLVNVSDGGEGPFYFKVVDEGGNWVGMNDGYKPAGWDVADPENSDGNFSVTKDEPILYLTIDTKKKEVHKTVVSAVTLTGDFNGWATDDTEPAFTYNTTDDVWESSAIDFTEGQGWKFRLNKADWYGDAGASDEIEGGVATTAEASANIATPGTGKYVVKVHTNRTPFVIEYVKQ